jgi:hypothetical protein
MAPSAPTLKYTFDEPSLALEIIGKLTGFTSKYILGVVITLGIFGNILSIVVFLRCKRKDLVTVTYLTPLAMADLGTLLYGAYTWLVSGVLGRSSGYFFFDDPFSLGPQIFCKAIGYIYRTSSCISSYLIVMFSFERCVCVWLPMQVHSLYSERRRKMLILIMVIIMSIVNVLIIAYYSVYKWGGTGVANCFYYVPHFSAIWIFLLVEIMDHAIPHILPCAFIFTLSVLIILGLWRAKRETKAVTKNVRNDSSLVSLLLICLLYIISVAPHSAVWGYCNYFNYIVGEWPGWTPQEITAFLMMGYFATSFSMLNYSFNFLIYACTLKIYKQELRVMIRQCRRRARRVKVWET